MLYVALLAAGVFAAAEGRQWWMSRQRSSAGEGSASSAGGDSRHGQPDASATNPGQTMLGPVGSSGMEALAAEPGDLHPPDRAVRRWCFQTSTGREIIQQARYECPGTIDAACDHYLREASAEGFELLSDHGDAAGKRMMTLGKGEAKMTLAVGKSLTMPDAASIVLTVIRGNDHG